MKISIDWIKDFTTMPDMDAHDLGVKFTMATCEVEEVETTGAHLQKVVAAKVLKIEAHPEADKLKLVTITDGTNEQTLVCGAPNVTEGMIAPYAPLGTAFPSGFTIEPKKIRGVESCGMLCGEDELGLGTDTTGLMVLPKETVLGKTMADLYDITADTILDIDNKSITHRPDLWGHHGMAREFALVFDGDWQDRFSDDWESGLREKCGNGKSPIVPKIEGDTCCKAYYGLSIDGVTVAESPQWMQQRLNACGLRPINSIVDISNYVMLELGMPNHIFDRDKIGGNKIVIRPAGNQTALTTLDEIERELLATDTVVADAKTPLVVAGVMGGLTSGVSEKTTKIFVESANWTDVEIRKTSTRIGLRTDSSQRYEKSLDSQLLEQSLLRITELILELNPDAKIIGNIEAVGPDTGDYTPLSIDVSVAEIVKVLGKEVSHAEIVRILTGLDYTVDEHGDTLHVTVPSFRATKDVEYEADIIEEIGRIVGYDNITPEERVDAIRPTRLSNTKVAHRKIQDFLMMNGNLLETMTNPMVGEKLLKKAQWSTVNDELTLVNALSKDHDRMRPSLFPNWLQIGAINSKNFDNFGCFEIGRQYLPGKKQFSEEHNVLAIALFDRKESRFMELANLVERLIRMLNIPAKLERVNEKFPSFVVDRSWPGLHPTESLDVKIMGRNLGILTTIHPMVAQGFKIKGNYSVAIIDLSAFEDKTPKEKVNYKPLPKFPGSSFDCTVVVDNRTAVADILLVVDKLKLQHYDGVKITDTFVLSDEQNAITLRTHFLDRENTLDTKFIEESQKRIMDGLDAAGYPLKS